MLAWVSSWFLFAGSLLSLAFTLHAYWPSKRSRALVLSFAVSLVTIELAGHHLVFQMAACAVLVALRGLEHWPGRIGLAIFGASWLGLLLLLLQGRNARGIMHAALGEFITNWSGPRIPLPHVMLPFPLYRGNVRLIRNVVYTRIAGRRLKLDVYLPVEGRGLRPAIMQIHGGAWIVGDKREQGVPLCTHLSSAGWVAFNVNYRLSPGATFPDHLIDLKRALVWIRAHAAEYNVDPNFIAVTGGSAGGHLAALVALTANDPRYQPGFENEDTRVQACVPFYGVYDFTNRTGAFPKVFLKRLLQAHVMKAFLDEEPEKFAAASPMDCVGPDAPPFLVIHGDRDTLAPLSDAREFVRRLRAMSTSEVFYAEIRGAQHAFDVLLSPRSAPVIEGVERFLDAVYQRYLATGKS